MNKIVYLDMDGVLADFSCSAELIKKNTVLENNDFSGKNGYTEKEKKLLPMFWGKIQENKNFYLSLPKKPKSCHLYDFCKLNFDEVKILTSVPRKYDVNEKERISSQKFEWIVKNIDLTFDKKNFISLTEIGVKKSNYIINSNNCLEVLIDDLSKNTDDWTEHGGVGVLFKNYDATIQALELIIRNQE